MLDLRILNGSVLDGSGTPSQRLDVGVRDGRVVELAPPGHGESARRTIDAEDRCVAPGFIDLHVHQDAQVFWDGGCSPSPQYGITTVIAGNCGFSVAPLAGDDYMMRLFARVEGIPLEALETGVPWNWRSFGDYLDAVEARGVAVNFGALVGHSAIRRAVLGDRSGSPHVTDSELASMQQLVEDALGAGALGFSSSWTEFHLDGDDQPVPSRAASLEELEAVSHVLAAFPGAQLEFVPTNGPFERRHADAMVRMAVAGNAPLNWNVLIPVDTATTESKLAVSDVAREFGAQVVALSYPDELRSVGSFVGTLFETFPDWAPVLALPPAQRLAALRDPTVRARLKAGADAAAATGVAKALIEELTVAESRAPVDQHVIGRKLGDLAEEAGCDAFDVMCDLAIADDLRTQFYAPPLASTAEAWEARVRTWNDPRVVIGASDGGAHLDLLTTFDYPARYLALAREREELSLERAIQQLTQVPARLYGLDGRGQLRVGAIADIVVFDPVTIDAGSLHWVEDLPAGAGRLTSQALGIDHVLVNGIEVIDHGRPTGDTPGTVLRRRH